MRSDHRCCFSESPFVSDHAFANIDLVSGHNVSTGVTPSPSDVGAFRYVCGVAFKL